MKSEEIKLADGINMFVVYDQIFTFPVAYKLQIFIL